MGHIRRVVLLVAVLFTVATPVRASTMCDPAYENCRVQLIALIDNEKTAIDVFMWFMQDGRYVAALDRAQNRGVIVRVLANARWPESNLSMKYLHLLADAGIPVRVKKTSGMLHTKAMVFHSQMVVEHGGANLSPTAFKPIIPYANYTDEIVQFNTDPSIVQTYMHSFDSWWINNNHFRNYANVTHIERLNGPFVKDARVQISTPWDQTSYRDRMVQMINNETVGVDAIQYRMTDPQIIDAVIAAHQRGVRVRILTDPTSYKWRDQKQYEDKLRKAGIQVKRRKHAGLTHEKFVQFVGQHVTEFGSQHWTRPEAAIEHNLWDDTNETFDWGRNHFYWKWNSPSVFN